MKWAWTIGRLAGIEIRMHATFLLILVWVGLAHYLPERSLPQMFAGLVFVMAIFGCVVLHELGHALTARRYGIKTRDITLLPIGGIARLEKMPDDPIQEVWVAIAGPAVNVAIALLLFLGLVAIGQPPSWPITFLQGGFFERLLLVNVILVLFNLLPAFPMDGGRVVRGLLATRLSYARATRIAASLGQGMAFLFAIAGLFWFFNPFLLFIALFVWIGAAQEANFAEIRSALGGVPVAHAMLTDFRQVAPDDPLGTVIELILSGSQQDFPVVSDGRVAGVLTRSDLLVALAKQGQSARVRDVMRSDFRSLDESEMLEKAFAGLQSSECKMVPVTRDGTLVGIVNLENIGEYIMIKSALEEASRAS